MKVPVPLQVLSALSSSLFHETDSYTLNHSGQDFSTTGSGIDANGKYSYLVVADGHGKGDYVKHMASHHFSWDNVVSEINAKDICLKIHREIEKADILMKREDENKYTLNLDLDLDLDLDFTNDGATLSIVKIYKKMIKCYWIGDSQIRIFDNETKTMLFKSKNHNGRNKKELRRLKEMYGLNCKVVNVPSLSVVDKKTIAMKKHPQIHFFTNERCEKMMVTRALGHNNKLFPTFQTKTLFLDELFHESGSGSENKICVVVASDGFWDMFCENEPKDTDALLSSTAKNLARRAMERWHQAWFLKQGENERKTNERKTNERKNKKKFAFNLSKDDIDDISIAIYRTS